MSVMRVWVLRNECMYCVICMYVMLCVRVKLCVYAMLRICYVWYVFMCVCVLDVISYACYVMHESMYLCGLCM